MRRVLVLAVTAGLLAVPAPAPAQTAPIAPTTLESWNQALQLFTALEGATDTAPTSSQVSGIVTDLAGWALGAVGIAVDDRDAEEVTENLNEISSDLTVVQNSLSSISQQLGQLQMELAAIAEQEAWADCAEQTQVNSGPTAVIQAAADDYAQFIQQAQNATASEPAPQVDALVDWAEEYTATNSLSQALFAIDDTLSGTTQTGSLQACGQALATMYAGSDLAFEKQYYNPLYQYLSYWYQVQVQGLNLYVEAQHVLALDAAGDLTGFQPWNPSAICTQDISGAVTTACDLAAQEVNTVYDNVRDQLVIAGAPYLWGSGGMVTAPPPQTNQKLWVVDINDFQSDGCSLPLTSNGAACGGTVGTTGGFGQPTWGPFSWGTYGPWQPAATADWLDLFPVTYQQYFNGGYSISAAMAASGFGDPSWGAGNGVQNLLIYTGEVTESTNDGLNSRWWNKDAPADFQNVVWGMCLFDTGSNFGGGYSPNTWVRPLCDDLGGGTLSALLGNYDPATGVWNSVYPEGGDGVWWGGFPWTNTAYYTADFSEGPKDSPWWINQMPGWMTQSLGLLGNTTAQIVTQQPTPQYRWPVLPMSKLTCSVTTSDGTLMSQTTSGGAYTMCGSDMTAWLAEQLPPAPIPVASSSVSMTPRLGAATVTWKVLTRQQRVVGYRIRGQRDGGDWRTLVADTSAKRATAAKRQTMSYPVAVKRSGMWRFKVVTLLRDRHSRPSVATRREFVATRKVPARFYTFTNGSVTRVAKATRDGRVYWVSAHRSGFGQRKDGRVAGRWSRGRLTWDGRWSVEVRGSWRHLAWDGWTRVEGPSVNRRGMPLGRKPLPRW